MRAWRHERVIDAAPGGTLLTDRLDFAPRFGAPLAGWVVRRFFMHRHGVLRRRFGCA